MDNNNSTKPNLLIVGDVGGTNCRL